MAADPMKEEKSLAKIEEEMKKAAGGDGAMSMDLDLKNPPGLDGVSALPGSVAAAAVASGEGNLPTLPPISQQQLLQANMAAIAAHASSNQNMVADLAAALRLGGAAPAPAALNDPRALAALQAAQMGNPTGDGRGGFNAMI